MLLFIDCETTGKWDFRARVDHPSQPHLVQLAAILCDLTGVATRHLNEVIIPEGYTIPPEATAIHRITTSRAATFGLPLAVVMDKLQDMIDEADTLQLGRSIAHNMQFDTNVLLRSFDRCGMNPARWGRLRPFCTMRALTPRMKLPFKPGDYTTERYKWPTLDEAHHFAMAAVAEGDRQGNEPSEPSEPSIEDRHSAMGDALMCRDIFLAGRSKGWWQ